MNQFLNRKTILIAGVTLLLIAGIIVALYFIPRYRPERSISLQFNTDINSIQITNGAGNCDKTNQDTTCNDPLLEATLQKSGTITVKDGVYFVIPSGEKVSDEPIKIEVSSTSTSFDIKPNYSKSYLATLANSEAETLRQVIRKSYPITATYTIDTGVLYHTGDWYATSLTPFETEANPNPDTHYIILHKTNGTWQVSGQPSLYFTYTDNKNIPRDIIKDVNSGIGE